MTTIAKAYWMHCLSPTHVGTGRGIGYIDLPLYRDPTTKWPAVPSSGFKGVWADHYHRQAGATLKTRKDHDLLKAGFGLTEEVSNAGALMVTDARLVCLPVRSFKGTFAWATSSLALRFLKRDLELAGFKGVPDLPATAPEALVATKDALALGGRVYLEDLDLAEKQDPRAAMWAEFLAERVFGTQPDWRQEFVKRFVVLPEMTFDYLTETGTEVTTRVRIDDITKTVADGQLWTEESLPAESILAGLVGCDRVNGIKGVAEAQLMAEYATKELQLQVGGKASVGRGKVRVVFTLAEGGK